MGVCGIGASTHTRAADLQLVIAHIAVVNRRLGRDPLMHPAVINHILYYQPPLPEPLLAPRKKASQSTKQDTQGRQRPKVRSKIGHKVSQSTKQDTLMTDIIIMLVAPRKNVF